MVIQLRISRCPKCFEIKRSEEFVAVIEREYWEKDIATGRFGYRTIPVNICTDCYNDFI